MKLLVYINYIYVLAIALSMNEKKGKLRLLRLKEMIQKYEKLSQCNVDWNYSKHGDDWNCEVL